MKLAPSSSHPCPKPDSFASSRGGRCFLADILSLFRIGQNKDGYALMIPCNVLVNRISSSYLSQATFSDIAELNA